MRIEIRELEGRDHFVVPVVMAVEGVLNGSRGKLFYPANVLRAGARTFNGKPVVVYHPTMYADQYADRPEIYSRQKVGVVFNSRAPNKRLLGDAWIDVERVKRIDSRVYDAIQSRKPMEVSTGLVTALDRESSGTFNGREFQATVTSILGDHLAVLPDVKGACSIRDGCGLVRNLQAALPVRSLA